MPATPTFERLSWPLVTARLTLRPARPADAGSTWRFRSRDDVTHWLTTAPATFEEYRERFERPAGLAQTLIVEREGEVVGDLLLKVDDGWSQAEISEQARNVEAELGWVLHPDHHGHGYATECVRELLRIAFDELGLRRVTANCFEANEASWRLMERFGMRRETRIVRAALHRSGEWVDGLTYALLAEEWRG